MRILNVQSLVLFVSVSRAFECTPSAFSKHLPSSARVAFTTHVPAGSTFQVPASDIAYPTSPTNLRDTCVVQVNVTSSSTSAYSFGLFLPMEWNSRFLAVGNGGFAGGINWLDMGAGLGYGFAVMSTDTGHNSTSADVTWALNREQRKIDFGYRAMHGSVVLAKELVTAYYEEKPCYNYYSGCSTGGRQGLKELELYPEDFDGVIAGSAAWWTTHLQTWTVKLGAYNLPINAPNHIPATLFPAIGAEVLKQCDGSDGLIDNIISDPSRCDFFAEALLCADNVTNQTEAGCLTNPQIDTLYHIYNNYVDTNQSFVFPHLELGSEAQWPVLLTGDAPSSIGVQYVQDMVLNDPTWQWQDFDYSIVELADKLDPGNATANDFDLEPFRARGGKLLTYHGLSDALIATGSSVYFYKHVLRTLMPKGIDLDEFYRFFLVPGMQHCLGTPTDMNAPWYFAGPNQAGSLTTSVHSVPGFSDPEHDILLALMAWVEHGRAPEQIIATKWDNDTLQDKVLRQRPLCVYPKQAMYTGKGNVDDAANWVCEYLYTM